MNRVLSILLNTILRLAVLAGAAFGLYWSVMNGPIPLIHQDDPNYSKLKTNTDWSIAIGWTIATAVLGIFVFLAFFPLLKGTVKGLVSI